MITSYDIRDALNESAVETDRAKDTYFDVRRRSRPPVVARIDGWYDLEEVAIKLNELASSNIATRLANLEKEFQDFRAYAEVVKRAVEAVRRNQYDGPIQQSAGRR
jgi:hypothetical protein